MTKIVEGSGWRSGHIKGTVYSSQAAYDNVNTAATEAFAEYLGKALDTTDYDYTIYGITSEHPTLDNENVICDSCADGPLNEFSDYINGSPERVEKDFNICLTNADYGVSDCRSGGDAVGCAYTGAKASVAEGADAIANLYGSTPSRYVDAGQTKYEATHTGIHEVGHNLDMSHNDGQVIEDRYGNITASPLASPNKDTNSCGYSNLDGSIEKLLIGFTSCEVSNIVVQ